VWCVSYVGVVDALYLACRDRVRGSPDDPVLPTKGSPESSSAQAAVAATASISIDDVQLLVKEVKRARSRLHKQQHGAAQEPGSVGDVHVLETSMMICYGLGSLHKVSKLTTHHRIDVFE
jgi:hypothetical protein